MEQIFKIWMHFLIKHASYYFLEALRNSGSAEPFGLVGPARGTCIDLICILCIWAELLELLFHSIYFK